MAVDLLDSGRRIKERSLDLDDRLEKLRMKIRGTRELANKVKVGVQFKQDTTVEVVAPDDPSESATSNKVSNWLTFKLQEVFFQTFTKPQIEEL